VDAFAFKNYSLRLPPFSYQYWIRSVGNFNSLKKKKKRRTFTADFSLGKVAKAVCF
jgi:hypothetical protein